jgi:hypothetical protein
MADPADPEDRQTIFSIYKKIIFFIFYFFILNKSLKNGLPVFRVCHIIFLLETLLFYPPTLYSVLFARIKEPK